MDVIEISWDQAQSKLQPDDVIVYEHKDRDRRGEAKVVATTKGIEIIASNKQYTSTEWSPSKWIKENITTSVPSGGHLQYIKNYKHNNNTPETKTVVAEKSSNRVVLEEKKSTKKAAQAKTEEKRKYISQSERNEIFDRTQGTCYLCRSKLPERGWHVEHIIPFSKNPEMDHGGNYLPACSSCNLRKGSRNLDTAINDKNFTVVTSVLSCKKLHPDVISLLQKAKEEKRQGNDPSIVAIRIDPDEDRLIEVENGLQYLLLEDFMQKAEAVELDEKQFDLNEMEELDVGGRGLVLKYVWNNQQVAIKKAVKNPEELEKEIKFLSTLKHPNVMSCLGYFKKKSGLHMVMELMPYSLADWIKDVEDPKSKKKPPKLNYLKIAIQISQALQYLHSYEPPVLHRDLKPPNVLIDANLNAKISDFGSSTVADSTRHDGTRVSSGYWTAPELKRSGNCNKSTDMYSLGKILRKLGEEDDFGELVELGDQCSAKEPRERLTIEVVLKKLQAL